MSDFVQILIKKKINEIRSKPLQELQNATAPFKFQSKDLRAVCQNEILSATRSCPYQIGAKNSIALYWQTQESNLVICISRTEYLHK